MVIETKHIKVTKQKYDRVKKQAEQQGFTIKNRWQKGMTRIIVDRKVK